MGWQDKPGWNNPATDDEVPTYPTVGESIPFHFGDGQLEIAHVKTDHGEARLYTVTTIDGQEELIVVDQDGMIHSIVCSDEQQLRVLLKTGEVELKEPRRLPWRVRFGLWVMGIAVTKEDDDCEPWNFNVSE